MPPRRVAQRGTDAMRTNNIGTATGRQLTLGGPNTVLANGQEVYTGYATRNAARAAGAAFNNVFGTREQQRADIRAAFGARG